MSDAQGDTGRRVGAVIVTYHPDLERLRAVLEAATPQVEEAVVVDNASTSRAEIGALLAEFPKARLCPLDNNLGIGAALNVGVEQLLNGGPDWVLTLDQDTVVHPQALARLFDEFDLLEENVRVACGVLAMSRPKAPPKGYRRQWLERSGVVRDLDRFRELRGVITSGNLVRADLFSAVRYNEEFFMDQVDTLFCADVRRHGGSVLECREPLMDHRLGTAVATRRGLRTYEGGIRLYYISRNAFSLVIRGDLAWPVFVRDIIGLSRVYVHVNGPRSTLRLAQLIMSGLRDAVLKRFGPRDDRLKPLSGFPGYR